MGRERPRFKGRPGLATNSFFVQKIMDLPGRLYELTSSPALPLELHRGTRTSSGVPYDARLGGPMTQLKSTDANCDFRVCKKLTFFH